MKAGNLNNSSRKTRKLIKKTFAEMLAEKREVAKISVSELCARAEISRGAFYSHYDDIYAVAEDYENELIDLFFDNARLLSPTNVEQFLDTLFDYVRENNENYKLLCKSNDFLFAAKKLTAIAENKFLQLCNESPYLKDKEFLEPEINVFIEGLLCEYVRYCRGNTATGLDELHAYTKSWTKRFTARRFGEGYAK
ncbi:MAG: TetR/AcrR family transcriptional regulator [Candidatus Borkfalkiaceae bacterium]|nr:TetR/AcrR family transcriptional regulator [Clostridia bacterium]MDY6222836.1 TetR/AcrR family transcriptional regulator [Christensenellaceae bacterium]